MSTKKKGPSAKQQAEMKGAWRNPAELKRCEDPAANFFWHAEPAWNKLALLAQAWRLVARGLRP